MFVQQLPPDSPTIITAGKNGRKGGDNWEVEVQQIKGPVEIGAITWWEKSTQPDIEHIREL